MFYGLLSLCEIKYFRLPLMYFEMKTPKATNKHQMNKSTTKKKK